MTRRRVGVLTDDQHPDLGHGLLEGPQDGVRSGQVPVAGGDLGAQGVADGPQSRFDGGEGGCPVGRDQLVQGQPGHAPRLAQTGPDQT